MTSQAAAAPRRGGEETPATARRPMLCYLLHRLLPTPEEVAAWGPPPSRGTEPARPFGPTGAAPKGRKKTLWSPPRRAERRASCRQRPPGGGRSPAFFLFHPQADLARAL